MENFHLVRSHCLPKITSGGAVKCRAHEEKGRNREQMEDEWPDMLVFPSQPGSDSARL